MKLSRILFILIALLVVGAILYFIRSKPAAAPLPIDKSKTVVAFGDSLVAGYGAGDGRNLVSELSGRLDTPIVNAGRNGDTTASGLARLDSDVLSLHPDVVIVLLGGNDALQRVPMDQTFDNLDAIITKIQNSGAQVLLLGVRDGVLTDTYKPRFERLAKNKNVAYVSNILSGLFTDSRYMYDAVHPNAVGYAKIADRVEPVLRKLLE